MGRDGEEEGGLGLWLRLGGWGKVIRLGVRVRVVHGGLGLGLREGTMMWVMVRVREGLGSG